MSRVLSFTDFFRYWGVLFECSTFAKHNEGESRHGLAYALLFLTYRISFPPVTATTHAAACVVAVTAFVFCIVKFAIVKAGLE